jgi:hypothetical protein
VGYEGSYAVSSSGEVKSLSRRIVRQPGNIGQRIRERVLSPGIGTNGYPLVVLCGVGKPKPHTVHRIEAEAHLGPIPAGMDVDHINGDRSDNSLRNLRVVSTKDNCRNKTETNNAHGHRGILFRDRGIKKWSARIKSDDKVVHLGSFMTIEEAIKARLDAESEYWGSSAPAEVRK